MATKKLIWIPFGILVISAWIFGYTTQAGAETLNYKSYSYTAKLENVSVGDEEGHTLYLAIRRAFYVVENGEVATASLPQIGDFTKGAGSYTLYNTITFADGSTIHIRVKGAVGAGAGSSKGEIIKGTGRFEGIQGTITTKTKYLPVEKGELGPKGYGEGTITYTLPPK